MGYHYNTGVITTFKAAGFGFIRPDNGGNDVFFHISRSHIPQEELVPGLEVRFKLEPDHKQPGRYRAADVTYATASVALAGVEAEDGGYEQ